MRRANFPEFFSFFSEFFVVAILVAGVMLFLSWATRSRVRA